MTKLDKNSLPSTPTIDNSNNNKKNGATEKEKIKAQTNQGKSLNRTSLRQRPVAPITTRPSTFPELDLSDTQELDNRLFRTITRLALPREVVMKGKYKDKAFYKDVIKQDATLSELLTQYKNASSEERASLEYPLLSCAFAYQRILNRAYKELGLSMDTESAQTTLSQTLTHQAPSQDKKQLGKVHSHDKEHTVRTNKSRETNSPDNLSSDEIIKTILSIYNRPKLERYIVMAGHHKDKVFYQDVIEATATLDEAIAQYKAAPVKKEALTTHLMRCAVDYQQTLNNAYQELGLTRK